MRDHARWTARRRKPGTFSRCSRIGRGDESAGGRFDQYRADRIRNIAAALTYRSVLSLFPGLIALVALMGGGRGGLRETFNAILQIVGGIAPHSTVQTI